MFSRKGNAAGGKARPGGAGLSFIGTEAVIGGDVTSATQLHIDGRIDGHVRCATLIQGESGTIAGNIVADEARIAGLVQGTVNAKIVVVEPTGRVTGDVTYETISISAGARIDGRLARREALASPEVETMLIATPTAPAIEASAPNDLFPTKG